MYARLMNSLDWLIISVSRSHPQTSAVAARTGPPGPACLLLVISFCAWTLRATAQQADGTGADDENSSKLVPGPATFITYCPWVNAAMNSYVAANPTYRFSWAGSAASQFVKNDVSITLYNPWVVNSPNVLGLDGVTRNRNVANQDAGGNVFQFKYTPQGTDPASVRFIQAYNESLTGSPYQIYLDRGISPTPFYDDRGVSGTAANGRQLANNVSWFQDTPYDTEAKLITRAGTAEGAGEKDTYSDVEFQVVVAVDNGAGGGFAHNLVLYGGYWWGYNYWNTDTQQVQADPDGTPDFTTDPPTYAVSNTDDPNGPAPEPVPEPAPAALAGVLLLLAAAKRLARAIR